MSTVRERRASMDVFVKRFAELTPEQQVKWCDDRLATMNADESVDLAVACLEADVEAGEARREKDRERKRAARRAGLL